jgi:TonB family protein
MKGLLRVSLMLLVLGWSAATAHAIQWPWKRSKPAAGQKDEAGKGDDKETKIDVRSLPKQSMEETLYVPPKAGKIDLPVYPYDLLRQRITGEASVSCMVGLDGTVVNTRVIRASRPEFGAALVAALEATKFGHSTREGEPIATVMGFRHAFNLRERGESDLQEELDLLERALRRPQTLGRARDLDRPLRAKERKPPAFPPSLLGRGVGGEALVEFLLDEQGRARLPRIVSATQPEFGYAAVHAVAHWEFDPPTARGAPTIMRVAVPFTFRVD